MSDEIKYLWEVPCNLCSKPKKYKVIKETEKTYLIGEYVQERVLKSRMGTNYVRYFESEEEVAECISDQLMHNYAWSVFEQHGCL